MGRSIPDTLLDLADAAACLANARGGPGCRCPSGPRQGQRTRRNELRDDVRARIAAVLDDRRGYDWSAEDSGVATSAVVARAVEEERSLLADVPDPGRRRWALLPLPDLLRRLGVVTAAGGFTNGGALLFAPFRLDLISYTPSDALRGAHGQRAAFRAGAHRAAAMLRTHRRPNRPHAREPAVGSAVVHRGPSGGRGP